jgi:hypothetical protein
MQPEYDGFECGNYFCANPDCVFHVRAGDAGTHGAGQWASLANGLTVSRSLVGRTYFCDICVRSTSQ